MKIGLIKMLGREKTAPHGKKVELKVSYEITLKSGRVKLVKDH